MRVTMRGNFHDWKISVESQRPVEMDSTELFDSNMKISSCYCEGFPRGRVFSSYAERATFAGHPSVDHKFTVELGSQYDVYTFLLLLMRAHFAPTGRFIERK